MLRCRPTGSVATLAAKVVEGRELFLLYWRDAPDFAAFRDDPECVEVMKRAGL